MGAHTLGRGNKGARCECGGEAISCPEERGRWAQGPENLSRALESQPDHTRLVC